jgi:hypothetical protein
LNALNLSKDPWSICFHLRYGSRKNGQIAVLGRKFGNFGFSFLYASFEKNRFNAVIIFRRYLPLLQRVAVPPCAMLLSANVFPITSQPNNKMTLSTNEGVISIITIISKSSDQFSLHSGGLTALSQMTHISDATFHQSRSDVETDPLWRPSRARYRVSRAVMSLDPELMLLRRIIALSIDRPAARTFCSDLTPCFRGLKSKGPISLAIARSFPTGPRNRAR